MHSLARRYIVIHGIFLLSILGFDSQICAGQAGGVQTQGPQFRLVRSVSGSKGTPQGGRFAMEDPRSVFYVPADHQVIVYMEWEGLPGKHHLEGFWRSPGGKGVAMSDFDYDAKDRRFGAYWTLALASDMENGNWSLEAHVDGELAGTHAFQVVSSAKPAEAIPGRKMYTPAQLYELALQSSVVIEKFDKNGSKFGESSGFLMEPSSIVTAFEGIDGATKLRVTCSDGKKFETDKVAAWNRRQDWVVLNGSSIILPRLKTAEAASWSIGDVVSFLDSTPEGNRVITNVSIDGKNSFPDAGTRLNISAAPTDRAVGSSLLNEYGEVIGIVTGTLIPRASAANTPGVIPRAGSELRPQRGLAVPVSAVTRAADASETPLAALEQKGEFLVPVTPSRNLVYGQLARSIETKGGLPFPIDGGDVFSRKDAKLYVYLLWEGHEKVKGSLTMRIFDLDNRILNNGATGPPTKLSLNRGDKKISSWETLISSLSPGIYRVDVWLNSEPVWRTFFRVTE